MATTPTSPDTLRYTKIPLNNGSSAMPAVGFGTLMPDPAATKQAVKTALEVGFRHFDCPERYRNEEAEDRAQQPACEQDGLAVAALTGRSRLSFYKGEFFLDLSE